jgi:hypothetical protein
VAILGLKHGEKYTISHVDRSHLAGHNDINFGIPDPITHGSVGVKSVVHGFELASFELGGTLRPFDG